MQSIFLLNCMIVKISSFVILHFCSQCFLISIPFEKFFFLINKDLKIFIKPAIRVCFWLRICKGETCIKNFIVMVHE